MKKYSIIILMIVLLSFSVYSASDFSQSCDNFGCISSEDADILTYFGDNNYPADLISTTSCETITSLYPTLSGEFVDNGQLFNTQFLYVPTTGTLKIYDTYCNLLIDEALTDTINLQPILSDYDSDGYKELIVANTTSVNAYNFENGSMNLETTYHIMLSDWSAFSCYDNMCYGVKERPSSSSGTNVTKFDLLNGVELWTDNSSQVNPTYVVIGSSIFTADADGVTLLQGIQSGSPSTSYKTRALRYDDDGNLIYSYEVRSGSVTIGGLNSNYSSFRMQIGTGTYDFHCGGYLYNSAPVLDCFALTQTGTLKKDFNPSKARSIISNIIISDFDRDGNQEIGFLNFSADTFDTYNTLFVKENSYSYLNLFNDSNYIGVQQTNSSESTQSIYTSEGLFLLDSNVTIQRWATTYNNMYPITAVLQSTSFITAGSFGNITSIPLGLPVFSVFDNTNSYIYFGIYNTSLSCGNDICDVGSENAYSCPEDCAGYANYTYTGYCLGNYQCTTDYPVCLGGVCVSGFSSISCTLDSNCPISAPICFQNYCISGSAVATIEGSQGSTSTTDMSVNINNAVNMVLGSNSFLKMIVAMLLVVFAMVSAYVFMSKYAGASLATGIIALICGFVVMIVVTMFGMIPIYILILFILGIISLWLLLQFILKPSSGE